MRLFYSNQIIAGRAVLNEEESKHCLQVLRLHSGDEVLLSDGEGHLWQGVLSVHGKKDAVVELQELLREETENSALCTLAVAPTKNIDRIEWLIEKATEIGLRTFIPIITHRTERHRLKLDRLQRIALSAMKQSNRLWLPKIHEPLNFQAALQLLEGPCWIAHCEEDTAKSLLHQMHRPGSCGTVLIGPEGDFSPDEITWAIEAGCRPVSLGAARLRVETAALYASVVLNLR
jgi:16S rRNA (uracil1498-N3)-methyltransferase